MIRAAVSYGRGPEATLTHQVNHSPLIVADFNDELARHHRAAFGWALACCRWDRSAAEDVLQTAYLRVVDGHARFNGHGDFRAFLFGVIRRTASEERRRRLVRSALSLSWLRHESPEPSVPPIGVGAIARSETSTQLLLALERLSPRQREVLHLVFYQDLTIAEASVALGISLGSARTHYERGKAQLRTLLGEVEDHAE